MNHKSLSISQYQTILGRKLDIIDKSNFTSYYSNKVVMITGGGGCLGSKIVHHLLATDITSVIVLDRNEHGIHLLSQIPDKRLTTMLIDCADSDITHVLNQYQPDIFIHCAGNKLVSVCEDNVESAIRNNILQIYNIVKCIQRAKNSVNIEFINLSTVQVDTSSNVMSLTKQIAEGICFLASGNIKTCINIRLCNVFDTSSNVGQSIFNSIDNSTPFKLTDKEYKYPFTTRDEVVSQILYLLSITDKPHIGTYALYNDFWQMSVKELHKNICHLMNTRSDYVIIDSHFERGHKYDNYGIIYNMWPIVDLGYLRLPYKLQSFDKDKLLYGLEKIKNNKTYVSKTFLHNFVTEVYNE